MIKCNSPHGYCKKCIIDCNANETLGGTIVCDTAEDLNFQKEDILTHCEYAHADIIERDDNGNIIGYGSHADYDCYATEVRNGQGYYDSNGHFHRREYNPED